MKEILAPAGNMQCALAAISAGADAVYLGYSAFSARAGAENFDQDGLLEIINTMPIAISTKKKNLISPNTAEINEHTITDTT